MPLRLDRSGGFQLRVGSSLDSIRSVNGNGFQASLRGRAAVWSRHRPLADDDVHLPPAKRVVLQLPYFAKLGAALVTGMPQLSKGIVQPEFAHRARIAASLIVGEVEAESFSLQAGGLQEIDAVGPSAVRQNDAEGVATGCGSLQRNAQFPGYIGRR